MAWARPIRLYEQRCTSTTGKTARRHNARPLKEAACQHAGIKCVGQEDPPNVLHTRVLWGNAGMGCPS
eukprot:2807675-Lingulodinium_polyedra.AAC.1